MVTSRGHSVELLSFPLSSGIQVLEKDKGFMTKKKADTTSSL